MLLVKYLLPFLLTINTAFFTSCTAIQAEIKQYDLYEFSLKSSSDKQFLFPQVTFTRPDGSKIVAEGFYDGENGYKIRAYCNQNGLWKWEINKNSEFNSQKGKFRVVSSCLKGKLKIHPDDPFQFARDNGDWFLHIGDTGYRYLTDTEPKWQDYIDHARKLGITKIRTWFCRSRSNVEALFNEKRTALDLAYWQEMDKRIAFALQHHPDIILQLIPFGEDTEELKRYNSGDSLSFLMLRYAQARFSAYSNTIWCISNDREIVTKDIPLKGRRIYNSTIDKIGGDMAKRESWTTLITNHQSRFSGYSFVQAEWSAIITLEDLDQVDGRIFPHYRLNGNSPIVNDEDRYEKYRPPLHPDYYFRRLMWASLLSGGHATYGGIRTFETFENDSIKGVQGYFNLGLTGGNSFNYIHKFFSETGLTMVKMLPDDGLTDNDPQQFKCAKNDSTWIIYLANPEKTNILETKMHKYTEIKDANESNINPEISIFLPNENFTLKWYDPGTGTWSITKKTNGGQTELQAPGPGDWILLLARE